MTIESLGGAIGKALQDKEAMKAELAKPSTMHSRFIFGSYRVKLRVTKIKMDYRTIGDAFILGHSDNGKIGVAYGNKLGLGELGSWTEIETIYTTQELTDVGKVELAKWLKGDTANYPDYFAVGTGTTAFSPNDIALGTEVTRKVFGSSYIDITNDAKVIYAVEVKSTDTAFHGSGITEIGLLNESSGGELFTRNIITSLTMVATRGYRFTFDLEIWDDPLGRGIFTTAGLNEIRGWLGQSSVTAPTHCAWGTGTTNPAAGDTTLEGEQERNAFVTSNRADNSVMYETLLAASEADAQDLYKSGLFNAGAAGTLFCEMKFAKIAKTTTFQVYEYDRIIVI